MSARLTQVAEDTVRVELGGEAYLIAAECPHRKGRMRFARVNEEQRLVVCPLHSSTFDLETGERRGGPACAPLRSVRCAPTPSRG